MPKTSVRDSLPDPTKEVIVFGPDLPSNGFLGTGISYDHQRQEWQEEGCFGVRPFKREITHWCYWEDADERPNFAEYF